MFGNKTPLPFFYQEMFERIDKEADGAVYVKEVTDFLRVLDDNLEQKEQVFKIFFDHITIFFSYLR